MRMKITLVVRCALCGWIPRPRRYRSNQFQCRHKGFSRYKTFTTYSVHDNAPHSRRAVRLHLFPLFFILWLLLHHLQFFEIRRRKRGEKSKPQGGRRRKKPQEEMMDRYFLRRWFNGSSLNVLVGRRMEGWVRDLGSEASNNRSLLGLWGCLLPARILRTLNANKKSLSHSFPLLQTWSATANEMDPSWAADFVDPYWCRTRPLSSKDRKNKNRTSAVNVNHKKKSYYYHCGVGGQ